MTSACQQPAETTPDFNDSDFDRDEKERQAAYVRIKERVERVRRELNRR